eukprot:TRINITY_DN2701_c0_g1_i3.p1 TRINITY_DN2701_c0_g1~~TRINITY_DN2701_c0_g1_i3.p1  ORF type:complete len:144 (+),score=16.65 TRINITY_DN2701_c0_g1_i3:193-624(+)
MAFPLATIVLAILALNAANTAEVPSEKTALQAFYTATNGASWATRTDWNTGTPCANGWFGVTCTTDSVTKVELSGNLLTGSIPSELLSLTSLQNLDLSTNSLSGSIPSQLSSLTSLQTLYFPKNSLSGSIPSQLSSLTSLAVL